MRSLQVVGIAMASPTKEEPGSNDIPEIDRTFISDHRPGISKGDDLVSVGEVGGDSTKISAKAAIKATIDVPTSVSAGASMARGALVGRYLMLDFLGAGGMGEVYVAYDPQLDRKVALKFLRTDLFQEGEESRARLLREAQAMARLSHPNVIAVHDVGMLEEQVFVAMEFVEGVTLSRWLQEQPHSWQEVLAVMKEAGQGLAAAHQAGLVHRDFKPDNVLLPREGRVRVLDFGLARSVERDEPEKPLQRASSELQNEAFTGSDLLSNPITHAGAIVGTPLYMAPEQLRGENADSRSDQYSFCVVLFEALYKKRPYQANTLAALSELKTRVPERPLDSNVPAWIHFIISKGLSVNREDRFNSIDSLLEALQKDPTIHRRRMRLGAGIASLALLAMGGAAFYIRSAPDTCEQSVASINEIWNTRQEQKIRAAFHATQLPYATHAFAAVQQRLNNFSKNWTAASVQFCKSTHFGGPTDEARWTRQVCFNRKLTELEAITRLFASASPEVVENARNVVESLSDTSECTELSAGNSLKPPQDALTRQQVESVRTQIVEARTRLEAGRYSEALQGAGEAAKLAPCTKYRPVEAEALLLLAQAQDKEGDWNAARVSLESALLAAEAGRHDEVTTRAWTLLVWIAGYRQAQYLEGRKSAKHGLAWLERIGNPLSIEADLYQRLGSVAFGEGKYFEALNNYQRAKDVRIKLLGAEHYEVANAAMNLANAHSRLGHLEKALEQYRGALTALERQFGAEHPDVARLLINMGITQTRLGNQTEALSCYQRAFRILERSVGENHPQRALALQTLASAQLRSGNLVEAEKLALRGFEIREKALGAAHPSLAPALSLLASIRMYQSNYSSALELYNRALTLQKNVLGDMHPEVAARHFDLGLALAKLRKLEESYQNFDRALVIRKRVFGEVHPDVAECYAALAQVQVAAGKSNEALQLFQQALEVHEKTLGAEHPSVAADLTGLAKARLAMGQPVLAAKLLDRSLKIRESRKEAPGQIAETRRVLAEVLLQVGEKVNE